MNEWSHTRIILLGCCIAAWQVFYLQWMVPGVSAANLSSKAAEISIRVHPNNEVVGSRIQLKDIALITADPFLKKHIEDIEIGMSPKPDQIAALDRRKIAYQIKAQDYLPKDLLFDCPQKIYVKRTGQMISQEIIEEYLDNLFKTVFKGKSYKIEDLTIRGLEPYPVGKISFSADSDRLIGKSGRLSGYLTILVDSVKVDRVNMSGRISVYDDILFAVRPLPRGEAVTPQDFYKKAINIYDYHASVVKDVTDIEGKILQTGIKKDDCLKLSNLADPPLVKKGEIITLVASHNHLKIITSGVSKEDGFMNEMIRVENYHSGKLVKGVVIDKSRVEVIY